MYGWLNEILDDKVHKHGGHNPQKIYDISSQGISKFPIPILFKMCGSIGRLWGYSPSPQSVVFTMHIFLQKIGSQAVTRLIRSLSAWVCLQFLAS